MKDKNISLTDEQIISGLKSEDVLGRDRALEALYVRNFPVIQNFVLKNSGHEDDAADAFQNAIIVFYEKVRFKNLELNCTIQTYLYSVCRNLWLDELRARKKKTQLVAELKFIGVEQEELSILEPEEQVVSLSELMKQLGEDCKKILGLYYFEKMRMKAIAQEMGYANEKVAKNLKGRCMKKLRAIAANDSKS